MENPSRLDEALSKLDPETRRVVELWLEGVSQSEAAEMLGLNERAFAVARMNAVERLRRLLGQVWERN